MALGIEELKVGVWTSDGGETGCTVLLPPAGTLGAMAVRGAAPGTREAATLMMTHRRTEVHGVVLSGGSAFGLATADGVVGWLEEHGIGFQLPTGVVPVVGAAILLDASATQPGVRPDAAAGRAACENATTADPPEGAVGAGAGAHVAKVAGIPFGVQSGQGTSVQQDGEVVVGALVANNAVGEVVAEDGTVLVGSTAGPAASRFPSDEAALFRGFDGLELPEGFAANTVIGCVVTNAQLTKAELQRVADLAHGGLVRAVRPAHTSLDGDALFGLATGQVATSIDLVADLAVAAVAEAARRGPLAAAG